MHWKNYSPEDKQKLLSRLKSDIRDIDSRDFTPEYFLNECLTVKGELASYQIEMVKDVTKSGRVCYRAPRGAGKSAGAALAILWFVIYHHIRGHDWKVATTAGVYRQLTRFLWPEVHKWARSIKWDVIGMNRSELEFLLTEIKGPTGTAFAMSSNDPNLLEGVHADYLLLVLDEAKSIQTEMWDALEGSLGAGKLCTVLAISTPGIPSGRFFEIQSRKEGFDDWEPKQIRIEDAIACGRVDPTWADQRKKQYGATSAIYKNYVLGEFSSPEEGGLIPLEWIEQAIARYPKTTSEPLFAGIDVAGEGKDSTVMAYANHNGVIGLKQWRGLKEQELSNRILLSAREVVSDFNTDILKKYCIDSVGLGGTICMLLEKQHLTVNRFCGSAAGGRVDGVEFANQKALGFWNLRQRLNPESDNPIFLPDDDELVGELVGIKIEPTTNGKVKISEKAGLKQELGRSPDKADAVMYAMWMAKAAMLYTAKDLLGTKPMPLDNFTSLY